MISKGYAKTGVKKNIINLTMVRQKAMMSHSIAVRDFAVALGVFSWSGPFA